MEHPIHEVLGGRHTFTENVFVCEKGPLRRKNEDRIAIITPEQHGITGKSTLLIVADGMGGMEGGEQASMLVASELPSLYLTSSIAEPVEALAHAVHEVNRVVYEAGRKLGSDKLIGSTLVAALVLHSVVVTINVGDSRAYLFAKGRLRQLSVDHTLRANFFLPFVHRSHSLSHVLAQAIGPHPVIRPHVAITTMSDSDLLLLCSDGLTSVVSDAEIERIIGTESFENIPDALRSAILRKNGEDDFSIIVSRRRALAARDVDS